MLSVLSIPYHLALSLSKVMDIREVRRQNLELLREQEGSVRALADRADTDPNYLSQILGGHGKHHMGHSMARRFEVAFSKPQGWMDIPHDDSEPDDEAIEIASLIKMLPPPQRDSIKSLIRSLIPSIATMPPYQGPERRHVA